MNNSTSTNDKECPFCGAEWDWAISNSVNQEVSVSQAERICLTEDGIFVHNERNTDTEGDT